jgi:hypothetical protein
MQKPSRNWRLPLPLRLRAKLVADYPEIVVTGEEFNAARNAAREAATTASEGIAKGRLTPSRSPSNDEEAKLCCSLPCSASVLVPRKR